MLCKKESIKYIIGLDNSGDNMMNVCEKCSKIGSVVFLVLGVLFLLRDINVWDFWNIQWWTVLFILIGVVGLCKSSCKDCQSMMKEGKKK